MNFFLFWQKDAQYLNAIIKSTTQCNKKINDTYEVI